MQSDSRLRGEAARAQLIARWEQVLGRVEAKDTEGVLELANVMDEFCEEAEAGRAAAPGEGGSSRRPAPFGSAPPDRCTHCQGFREFGGCFGTVDELDRAVLSGEWNEAARIVRRYLELLHQKR